MKARPKKHGLNPPLGASAFDSSQGPCRRQRPWVQRGWVGLAGPRAGKGRCQQA